MLVSDKIRFFNPCSFLAMESAKRVTCLICKQPKIMLKGTSHLTVLLKIQRAGLQSQTKTVLTFTGCSLQLCTQRHAFKYTHIQTHMVHATCWSRDGESPFWLKLNSREQLNQRPAFDHLVIWTWQVTIWLIKCKWQSVLKILWM